eukprot:323401-Alexandrium_andersonii.AAC.1
MDQLRPGSGLLRGPEGTTGGAALDRAIEAVAQAGLADRRNTERAAEEVHRAARRLRAVDARQHEGAARPGPPSEPCSGTGMRRPGATGTSSGHLDRRWPS